MNKIVKHMLLLIPFLVLSIFTMLVVSCSSTEKIDPLIEDIDEKRITNETVVLTVYVQGDGFAEGEFQSIMADPINRKFPYIKLDLVRPSTGKSLEHELASGNVADIIFTGSGNIGTFTSLLIPADAYPYLQKYKMNTTLFEPQAIEEILSYSAEGKLQALPFSINFSALFYNKAIFDKFAVPYPHDGMNWNEVLELGKNLTRIENEISYVGLHVNSVNHLASQLSLPYIDLATNKATITTDGWKRVFELYASVIEFSRNKEGKNPNEWFLKDGILAMIADYGGKIGQIEDMAKKGKPLQWDLASYPVHEDVPGVGLGFVSHVLIVSDLSKHKEEAFRSVLYLTGEEHQRNIAKFGRQPALADWNGLEGFGEGIESLKGKNIAALFANKPAPNPVLWHDQDLLKKEVKAAGDRLGTKQTDINTALRELEENLNKTISAQNKK